MAIDPQHTFRYQFSVRACEGQQQCWAGEGVGQSDFGKGDGLVGPKPRFELSFGWLILSPADGWTRSLSSHQFSDSTPRPWEMDKDARTADIEARGKLWLEAQSEAFAEIKGKATPTDFKAFLAAKSEAMERALRRRGMSRDLVSYSLFVGEALRSVLTTGDKLNFSRDANGDFRYWVVRNLETIFSAGSVGRADDGGSVAVWQEYDKQPNPNAAELKKKSLPLPVAEWFEVHRPYITVRVKEQVFHLLDGQEVDIDPYYVFLARSNKEVPVFAFEFTPRAVHSAGRLDTLSKELLIDAAAQLTKPRARLL